MPLAAARDEGGAMVKYVELRRHTDADGDVLTPEGVSAAIEIGSHLRGGYEVLVSSGAQRALQALREADPELVEEDSATLAAALRRVLESLPDGGRALVAGHSPTNEAAVLGLAGEIVEPISKGGGVLVVEEDGALRVEKLD